MHYHGSDLRRGRYSQLNRPYLITTVTHNRHRYFNDFDLARILIRELQATCNDLQVESLAWVVMPDHLHWLFELGEGIDLSALMNRIKSESGFRINRSKDAARGSHSEARN